MLIPPNPIKMSKLNMFEQVEQVLTDAHRCSDVGTMDFEQVVLPLGALSPSPLALRCSGALLRDHLNWFLMLHHLIQRDSSGDMAFELK